MFSKVIKMTEDIRLSWFGKIGFTFLIILLILLLGATMGVIMFRYSSSRCEVAEEFNPNGSSNNIAGIINKEKNILGMMPHPEAFLHRTNHPSWTRRNLPEEGDGLGIFKRAVEFIRSR